MVCGGGVRDWGADLQNVCVCVLVCWGRGHSCCARILDRTWRALRLAAAD